MAEGSLKPSTLPEEIKKYIRAVLLSKLGGVPLNKFCVDYSNLAGRPLKYTEYGFSSLEECLKSIPDAVRFEYSKEAGIWMLYGIGDPNSFMSSAAKKAQIPRPNDDNSSGKEKAESNNFGDICSGRQDGEGHGTNEELRVPKNRRGLYTVCVGYSDFMPSGLIPGTMEEIMELFAQQGDVIETSSSKKLSFFRFKKEEEAIAVIKKYDGRCLRDGTIINIGPAKEKLGEVASRNQSSNPTMEDRQNNRMEDRTREKEQRREEIRVAKVLQNGWENAPMPSRLVDILVSNLHKSTTWRELKEHFRMFDPVKARVYRGKAQDQNECAKGSVSFSCIANAKWAVEAMNGSYLRESKLSTELKRYVPEDEARKTSRGEDRSANNAVVTANPSQQKKNKHRKKGKGKTVQSKSNLSKDHEDSNITVKSSSDAESIDSITPELVGSGGSRLKLNVYERNVAPSESFESWDAETSGPTPLRDRISEAENSHPRPCTPQGFPLGRGRGRGMLGVLLPAGGVKKPHRPSLADLADRLEEL